MGKRTSRDAKIRFYDGAVTPYYLELDFDAADISFPLGTPRQEENMQLDRGKATEDMHYVKGSDMKLMEPQDVTFSVFLRDGAQTVNLINWLKAMSDGLSTQVNSKTLTSTQGDTQRDGANNNPVFADSNKGTFNIEYLVEMGATDLGWKLAEVFVPLEQVQITESENDITAAITGKIYGTIGTITSFTAGTDVEA